MAVRESVAANIEALLARCGLELCALVAAPQAAGEATLIDDEKELGVALLDIGARETMSQCTSAARSSVAVRCVLVVSTSRATSRKFSAPL